MSIIGRMAILHSTACLALLSGCSWVETRPGHPNSYQDSAVAAADKASALQAALSKTQVGAMTRVVLLSNVAQADQSSLPLSDIAQKVAACAAASG